MEGFLGGFQPPQTPWTWRSGARVPGHAGPIVAKLPSKNRYKKEKKRKKREDTMKKTITKENRKRQHKWNHIHGSGAKRRFAVREADCKAAKQICPLRLPPGPRGAQPLFLLLSVRFLN